MNDNIEIIENGIVVKNVDSFELKHVFDCGQCFRWNKQIDSNYIGIAYNKVIELSKKDDDLFIYNIDEKEFIDLWSDYFDLKRDYSKIKEKLSSEDEILKKAIPFGCGIRILNQDPLETIISFIISANNRIPMIKRCIENISRRFGETIEYRGKIYYAFPSIDELKDAKEEDFKDLGAGFRAKYIKDTVSKIYNKEFDIDEAKKMEDEECHIKLQELSGVGAKVSDCIMLFSMKKYSAFPVDVWVKRAMNVFYNAPENMSLNKIRKFAQERFGNNSGIAQQYLFYYARENKIKL
ncbi:MAG: 8-oxoguanine DNA glycosylase [Oscillospiraceae bacterium]|nr:8-oxoguanine DNA glycosylase [Oscillospiraceae bacterium]